MSLLHSGAGSSSGGHEADSRTDLVPAPDIILDPDLPFDVTTGAGSSMDSAPDQDPPRAEGSWIRIQEKSDP